MLPRILNDIVSDETKWFSQKLVINLQNDDLKISSDSSTRESPRFKDILPRDLHFGLQGRSLRLTENLDG